MNALVADQSLVHGVGAVRSAEPVTNRFRRACVRPGKGHLGRYLIDARHLIDALGRAAGGAGRGAGLYGLDGTVNDNGQRLRPLACPSVLAVTVGNNHVEKGQRMSFDWPEGLSGITFP